MPLRRLAVTSAVLSLLACGPKPTLSMDAILPPAGNVGTPYSVTFSVSGAQGAVAFTSTGTLPPGLALATSGTLSGTPTAAGQYSFAIKATDSAGSVTSSYTVAVLAHAPPSITTASLPDGVVGRAYATTLAGEAGETPYTWSVSNGALPAGLSLSAAGALSGTPTAAGTSSFEVRLVDARGQSARAPLLISIVSAPAIATAAIDDGYAGLSYAFAFQASSGTAPYTWDISAGALPAGLSMSSSGAVTGTPESAGVSSFTVRVTDAAGLTDQKALALTLYAPLALETTSLPDGVVGIAYSAALVATGGKTPLTYSVTAGALPSGVALSGSTLAGTPGTAQSASFTIRVADQNGRTASKSLSLTVLGVLTVTTSSLPDGYVPTAYGQPLQATGGKAPYTWSLTAGALPGGLSLSSGAISGTPTIATSSTVTVQVSDGSGHTASKQLSIATYSLPSISTTSLPNGTIGQWYDQTLAASNGKPTYWWSYTGALPVGLAFDGTAGRIYGSPTTAGTSSVNVTVHDTNGRYGVATLSITVAGSPIDLSVASWNIEFFGDTGMAPTDDALQLANATGVIADAGFALWGVEEIVSTAQFQTMLSNLPGYSGFLADDPRVPGGTTYYSPTEQKVGVVYQTARVTPVAAQLILASVEGNYLFAGRPPLRVDFQVDGGGPLSLIVLHMKAGGGTDVASWSRRVDAGTLLKGYLDQNMPSDRVLVVGDWNDDVDQSITTGLDTPYRPIIDDTARYHFVTDYLSNNGYSSEVNWPDVIDHHLATNEMDAIQVGNPEVVRPDLWAAPIASYGTTTSDHYPIVSRYAFGGGTAW